MAVDLTGWVAVFVVSPMLVGMQKLSAPVEITARVAGVAVALSVLVRMTGRAVFAGVALSASLRAAVVLAQLIVVIERVALMRRTARTPMVTRCGLAS